MPRKSKDARTQAQQELTKLARRANDRIRALKKADINSPAYNKAKQFLRNTQTNRVQFAVKNKTLTEGQVSMELQAVKEFLNSKTSTVSGYKKVQANKISVMKKKGFKTDEESKTALNFFKTKLYEKLRDNSLSSEQILDLAVNFKNLTSYEDIEEMSNLERDMINRYTNKIVLRLDPSKMEQDEQDTMYGR